MQAQGQHAGLEGVRRVALVKPCCIGDVVFATALLKALKRALPEAQIDWWVGRWSADAVRDHPALHRLIETGERVNPAGDLRGLIGLAMRLRRGFYDLLVVPDRSLKLSLAALLSGIPLRAGLDSAGRGFGYTLRARIDPDERRHEGEIYLDIARSLGIDTTDCWANSVPTPKNQAVVRAKLQERGIPGATPLVLIHPGGGVNPGMTLTSKRWPVERFATLAAKLLEDQNRFVIVLGNTHDQDLTQPIVQSNPDRVIDFTGALTLPETAALASLLDTQVYIGNDNGVAHLAAGAGARVLMIFGPSDPVRYAPFGPPERVGFVWRPVPVVVRGVAGQDTSSFSFDWGRDGVNVDEVWTGVQRLLGNNL